MRLKIAQISENVVVMYSTLSNIRLQGFLDIHTTKLPNMNDQDT
jgi:hypothetical protein